MVSINDHSNLIPATAMPDYLIRYTTLRQLQIFEATVRLGSFTRAAEELFLTQPTVSMQIKKLSDSIDIALFEHVGRKAKPTEAGLELYESCRKIFDTLANLEMKISDIKGIRRGTLRLGVITTAQYFAPEILGEFSKQFPGIEVALQVSNRDEILRRINNDEDDLHIMGNAPESEIAVEVFPFAPNPLVIMAPRDHHLVGKKNLTLKDLADEPFILREPGSGIRNATLKLFDQHNIRPKVKMELGSNEAIKHAIVGGLGISVLSLHTLTLEGPEGPVALLDVKEFPIMRKWFIVYPKGKELSLVAQAFLDFALGMQSIMKDKLQQAWPALSEDFEKFCN